MVVVPKSIFILYESMDVLIMTVEKSLFTRIAKNKEESNDDKSILSSFFSLLHMTFLLPFSDQLPYFRNKNVLNIPELFIYLCAFFIAEKSWHIN